MSITKDFSEAWDSGEFDPEMVTGLLNHTRALEAMLKEFEWVRNSEDPTIKSCPKCGRTFDYPFEKMEHEPRCQLAKLLEGIE